VQGLPTYPPSGNLNLTTVSVTDHLTLVGVLNQWAASDRQVVPRSAVYTPGLTDEQVQEKNAQDFSTSEMNAESAAVRELGLPSVVAIAAVVAGSAADGKLRPGDRISAVDGTAVADPEAVNNLLQATKPGDPATSPAAASSRAPGRSRPTAWCRTSAASSSRWPRHGRRAPPSSSFPRGSAPRRCPPCRPASSW
jgi:PDZ domain-containing protein